MAKAQRTIRIIAGSHRSRRLPVLNFDGLRPTGDRVRETLFNWLQIYLPGRKVLDLCAGAGALGFEAASRGAKSVVMVEKSNKIARKLEQVKDDFKFSGITVLNQTAQNYLLVTKDFFDVVFIDPPFVAELMDELTLLSLKVVNIGGFIYREAALSQSLTILPDNWKLYRQKTMGQVKIELWQKISTDLRSITC